MKNLSAFTPINEDPKVVKAIETIKECRMEWEVARVAYAELALPKTKERFYEAEQALRAGESGAKCFDVVGRHANHIESAALERIPELRGRRQLQGAHGLAMKGTLQGHEGV